MIQQIRMGSNADQWKYVASEKNQADYASRGMKVEKFMDATWCISCYCFKVL